MSISDLNAALGFAFRTRDYFQLSGERAGIALAGFETVMADTTIAATYVPPNAAQAVRVRAGGNAADDAAGTGAQQVTVEGLDVNNQIVSAVLTTAGAAASAFTTQSFLRVNYVTVTRAGSGGINVGNVQIENQVGPASNSGFILAGRGRSQTAFYSAPQGTARTAGAFIASSGVGVFLQDGLYVTVRSNPANLQVLASIRNTVNNLPATQVLVNLNGLAVGNHSITFPVPLRVQRPASIGDLTDVALDLFIQAQSTLLTTDVTVLGGGYFQFAQ